MYTPHTCAVDLCSNNKPCLYTNFRLNTVCHRPLLPIINMRFHLDTIYIFQETTNMLFSWLDGFARHYNNLSFYPPGPFPCGFPKIGISQKSGFRAFLGISGCFYGDFKCPRAPEIHIFCLKSRFLREILKKARNPNFRENHMGRPLEVLIS